MPQGSSLLEEDREDVREDNGEERKEERDTQNQIKQKVAMGVDRESNNEGSVAMSEGSPP